METKNVKTEVKENKEFNFFDGLDKNLFAGVKNKKTDIYKEKAYRDFLHLKAEDLISDTDKKTARRYLRKIKNNMAFQIYSLDKIQNKNKMQKDALQKAIDTFKNFYLNYFTQNDFSLQSLLGRNASDDNTKIMSKALEIIIENSHL